MRARALAIVALAAIAASGVLLLLDKTGTVTSGRDRAGGRPRGPLQEGIDVAVILNALRALRG